MLRNELSGFDYFLSSDFRPIGCYLADADLGTLSRQIQEAWLDAVLSGMPADCLVPYFNFQLKGLSEIADTLQFFTTLERKETQTCVLALIDHLRLYYADYLHLERNAPAVYRERMMTQLSEDIRLIRSELNSGSLNPALTANMNNWLSEHTIQGHNLRFTFRALDYMAAATAAIAHLSWESPDIEHALITLLIQINFNQLAFFNYLKRRLLEQESQFETLANSLAYLWKQRAEIMAIPQQQAAYDPSWPALKSMMGAWLDERIRLILLLGENHPDPDHNNHTTHEDKLTLSLSVAYLACLIKLFYDEDVFGVQSLSSIFQFFSAHFNTKKQTAVSAKSLSKEFYSINLHTAAHIRDLLQKMIARINRNFFPVWVVISIIIGVHSGR